MPPALDADTVAAEATIRQQLVHAQWLCVGGRTASQAPRDDNDEDGGIVRDDAVRGAAIGIDIVDVDADAYADDAGDCDCGWRAEVQRVELVRVSQLARMCSIVDAERARAAALLTHSQALRDQVRPCSIQTGSD